MGRTARILTWSAGIFVGLIALGVGAGYLFVTSDEFRSHVESGASNYSGRKTKIAKISIDWGTTAHIRLAGVQLANADWAKADHMLKVEEVDFRLQAVAATQGRHRPATSGPAQTGGRRRSRRAGTIELEPGRKPGGGRGGQGGGAEEAVQTPLIGRLEITEGKIPYQDGKRKLDLDGTISTAQGKAGDQPQAELSLKGKLEGQPLSVRFVGGSVLMLRDTKEPYPLDLDIAFGGTKLTEGHGAGSIRVERPRRRTHALGAEPVRDLSAARHSWTAHAALQDQRQA